MIKLLLLIIALVAGLVVGPEFAGNQGYVLISAAEQTIEMSLTTLVILVALFVAALFLLEWILRKVFSISSSTIGWFSGRKTRKARINTYSSMVKLLEGDWKQAEKLAAKGIQHSDEPLLNYLVAAEAAQGMGDVEQRDLFLQQAGKLNKNTLALSLTRAKLQIRQGQFEEALATLQAIKQHHPRNPIMLALLKEIYLKLQDWQPLLEMLPVLKKANLVDGEQQQMLEVEAERGLMAHIATQKGSEGLLSHWNSLSKNHRQQPALLVSLVRNLIERNADSEAYIILREALKKHPDEQLIALVPELNLPDYHPVILKLQDLLRYNESNPVTHSVLGQLYVREGKWDEAKTHFERALEIRPDVADYAYLADVLEKLNQSKAAGEVSRTALRLALPEK